MRRFVEPPGSRDEVPLLGGDVTEGLVRIADPERLVSVARLLDANGDRLTAALLDR